VLSIQFADGRDESLELVAQQASRTAAGSSFRLTKRRVASFPCTRLTFYRYRLTMALDPACRAGGGGRRRALLVARRCPGLKSGRIDCLAEFRAPGGVLVLAVGEIQPTASIWPAIRRRASTWRTPKSKVSRTSGLTEAFWATYVPPIARRASSGVIGRKLPVQLS
jgi:hypothetical protein